MRVLYICYLSLDDPLVHTQVLAYLEGLSARGHEIVLLTFDPRATRSRHGAWRASLAARGITWYGLTYHKRPSLPATAFDVLRGIVAGARLVRRHRIDLVHARSHVPAAMSVVICRLTRRPMLFDLRGLMAEEYRDAGRWKQGSLAFRLTKRVEALAMRRAGAMVVLTERLRDALRVAGVSIPIQVIPCCSDVERIAAQLSQRDAVRSALSVGSAKVVVYVGKVDTGHGARSRYMLPEMIEWFVAASSALGPLHFLVVTQSAPELVIGQFAGAGIPESAYTVTSAGADETGAHLAAADLAIAFVRPRPSEIAASPTKIGEYLAAGLTVVASAGVGDVDDLLKGNEIGVLVDQFAPAAYRRSAEEVARLMDDSGRLERCRTAANERYSLTAVGVPRYDQVYRWAAGVSSGARPASA